MNASELSTLAFAVAFAGSVRLGTTSVAHAAPSGAELQIARELFVQAEDDERRGDFEAARSKLERVASIKATAAVHLHLGICDEHAGRLVSALDHFDEAEKRARADGKQDVLRAVEKPREALARRIPRLVVHAPKRPPGLVVTLDDKPFAVQALDTEQRIELGTHHLAATAPNHEPYDAEFSTLESSHTERTIHLVPVGAAAGVHLSSTATGSSTADGPGKRSKAVLVTAGAVVLLAGGTTAFIAAGARADDIRTECAGVVSCDSNRSSIRFLDAAAVVGWAAGTAATVWSVLLWATPSTATPSTAHATGSAELLLGPTFSGVRGAF